MDFVPLHAAYRKKRDFRKSPEPDGTFRTYFLRVPPTVTTARGGIAWTFDLSEQDYLPLEQT